MYIATDKLERNFQYLQTDLEAHGFYVCKTETTDDDGNKGMRVTIRFSAFEIGTFDFYGTKSKKYLTVDWKTAKKVVLDKIKEKAGMPI